MGKIGEYEFRCQNFDRENWEIDREKRIDREKCEDLNFLCQRWVLFRCQIGNTIINMKKHY